MGVPAPSFRMETAGITSYFLSRMLFFFVESLRDPDLSGLLRFLIEKSIKKLLSVKITLFDFFIRIPGQLQNRWSDIDN